MSRNTDFYEGGTIPWLNTKEVDFCRIYKTEKYITELGFQKSSAKWIPENSVIVAMYGATAGKVALNKIPLTTNQACCNLVIDNKKANYEFIYYYLSNSYSKLANLSNGAAQQNLNTSIINDFPISLPPLTEQKAIARILGSLDDKIELNRQMNETLEAMAQALFKSWFVDFDPVIDNALAAGKPIPDELSERAEQRKAVQHDDNQAVRALFPDEFVLTEEMGWIPKGWEVKSIYDTANFINGSSFESQYFSDKDEGLPIIKIAEIKNGISGQTKFTTQKMPEKYLIGDGDILFSWSGNPDTSIDTFIWTGGDGWLNQHIFNVVLYEKNEKNFIYYLLKHLKPIFTEIARDKQTTGLGHVTVKDMKRTYVIKPSALALSAFELNSNSIFQRWYQNLFTSKKLTIIRDTLLPKLLSGELRIPDAAALFEDI